MVGTSRNGAALGKINVRRDVQTGRLQPRQAATCRDKSQGPRGRRFLGYPGSRVAVHLRRPRRTALLDRFGVRATARRDT